MQSVDVWAESCAENCPQVIQVNEMIGKIHLNDFFWRATTGFSDKAELLCRRRAHSLCNMETDHKMFSVNSKRHL